MRILITGGGGFLGQYVVRDCLNRGYTVRVLGRSPYPFLAKQGVECIQGSITHYPSVLKAAQGIEAVFHVASKAGIWGNWCDYYQTNVWGTHNVLKACQQSNVQYCIYTSTPSVVFNGQSFENADESLPYGFSKLSPYAYTKALAEKEVLAANTFHFKTTALRPHLIWGPGDPHLLTRVLEKAKRGKLIQVGEGLNLVDITFVENASYAHLLALDALQKGVAAGQAYFIGQNKPVNLWKWIQSLLKLLDIQPIQRKISFNKAYTIGLVCEYLFKCLPKHWEPPMTRFVATQLATTHYFSHKKAERDLGYTPRISIQEGLNSYAEFYKTLK